MELKVLCIKGKPTWNKKSDLVFLIEVTMPTQSFLRNDIILFHVIICGKCCKADLQFLLLHAQSQLGMSAYHTQGYLTLIPWFHLFIE